MEQRRGKYLPGLIFGLVLFPQFALGVYWIDEFTSFSTGDSGTAVWNISKGMIHPPLQVKDYVNFNGSATLSKNFSVGTGEHGVFDSTTYSNFSENQDVSGSIITVNTSTYPSLNVTSMTIDSGWTLRPTGNSPLIIYAQGDVVIKGSIDCSGDNGGDYGALGVVVSGGLGRCGGGNGGDGATASSAAGPGTFLGATIVGGGSGGSDGPSAGNGAGGNTSGSGGGGGGAYTQTGAGRDAVAGTTAGGGAGGGNGEVGMDHQFTVIGGGAGGGGGAAFTGGTVPQRASGASGGAGGGAIVIYAFGKIHIEGTGSILAKGGTGGGSSATFLAGGGGGGGGGSIHLLSAEEVTIDGTVSARYGDGGGNGSGASGGNGAQGRTWIAGRSGYSVNLAPIPSTLLGHPGRGRFQTGSFTYQSRAFDALTTKPSVSAMTLTTSLSASSTATVDIASGEESSFSPSWVVSTSIENPLLRYLRFRVNLNNASETEGAFVTGLTTEYSPFFQEDFEFQGGCGLATNTSQKPSGFIFLLLLPVLLTILLKFKSQSEHNV